MGQADAVDCSESLTAGELDQNSQSVLVEGYFNKRPMSDLDQVSITDHLHQKRSTSSKSETSNSTSGISVYVKTGSQPTFP